MSEQVEQVKQVELFAETTENLADYLWWLLPVFFKKKAKYESGIYQLLEVFGKGLEDVREQILLISRQFAAKTAEGEYLDNIGLAYGTYRLPDENDRKLRSRIMTAFEKKQKEGTAAGLIEALKALGFDVEIKELFRKNRSRWAEFIVRILKWDGKFSQDSFYSEVNRMKPAHTRMVADPAVVLDTWDDGGILDMEQGSSAGPGFAVTSSFDSWRLP